MPVELRNIAIIAPNSTGQIDLPCDINLTGSPPPVYRINGVPIGGGAGQWTDIGGGGIYYSGGNVGIGTATPRGALTVYSSTEAQLVLGAGPGYDYGIYRDGTTGALTFTGSQLDQNWFQFVSYTSAGMIPALSIQTNGNVGIGTATPGSTLSVSGSTQFVDGRAGTFDVAVSIINNNGGATVGAGVLRISVANTDPGNAMIVCVNSTGSVFEVRADGTILLSPWGGNVGIGTVAPASLLHISSSSFTTATIQTTASTASAKVTLEGDQRRYDIGVGGSLWGEYANAFYVFDQQAAAARLYIAPTGNVGIGTASPGARLHVEQPVGGNWSVYLTQSSGSWISTTDFVNYRFLQTASAATDGNFKGFAVGAGGVGIGYGTPPYGSNDALYVNGNVGIGVSDPTYALDVISPIRIRNTAGISGVWYDNAWDYARFFAGTDSAADSWRVYSPSVGNVLVVQQQGNVGIATDTPAARLQSNSNVWSPGTNGVNGIALLASGAFGGGIGLQDGAYTMSLYSNAGNLNFGTGTAGSATASRMVIGANGCVSIGTITIGDQLNIVGLGANGFGQLRIVEQNYGAFFRMDTGSLYLMTTNLGDPWGSWKTPFPLQIDLASCAVAIGAAAPNAANALTVGGNVNITGQYLINGVAIPATSGPTTFASGGRAFDAVYQNNTGKPMWVSVYVYFPGVNISVKAYADGGNPPGTEVAEASTPAGYSAVVANLSFVVLPGYYYEVRTLSGIANIRQWSEWW